MKRFLVYLVWALFPIYAIATNYVVQVNTELNVRSEPNADAMCVGKLRNGTQVDVTAISDGWAVIDYNGNTCYVTAKYLVSSGQGAPIPPSAEKSGTSTWKIIMWIVLGILGIVIFKYAFAILIRAIDNRTAQSQAGGKRHAIFPKEKEEPARLGIVCRV